MGSDEVLEEVRRLEEAVQFLTSIVGVLAYTTLGKPAEVEARIALHRDDILGGIEDLVDRIGPHPPEDGETPGG